MEISFAHQLWVFIMSFIVGIFYGVIYDFIRIIRCLLGIRYNTKIIKVFDKVQLPLIKKTNKNKKRYNSLKENVIIVVTDIAYFFVITVFTSIFVYSVNNGRARWFMYVMFILGFMLYYFTVGRLVILLSGMITFFIRAIFAYVLFFIRAPFIPLVRGLRAFCIKAKACIGKRSKVKKDNRETKKVLIQSGKNAL